MSEREIAEHAISLFVKGLDHDVSLDGHGDRVEQVKAAAVAEAVSAVDHPEPRPFLKNERVYLRFRNGAATEGRVWEDDGGDGVWVVGMLPLPFAVINARAGRQYVDATLLRRDRRGR